MKVLAWIAGAIALAVALVVQYRRRVLVGSAMALASVSVYIGSATIPGGGEQTLNCSPAVEDTMTNDVSHLCGFADVTNTGPTGTLEDVPGDITSPNANTGSGWSWNAPTEEVRVTADNAVVKNIAIDGSILVESHDGATIQNCDLVTGGDTSWGVQLRHANDTTIQDCTIRGTEKLGANRGDNGIRDVFGDSESYIIRRNEIYWFSSCMNNMVLDGLVQQNYCHDMGFDTVTGLDHTNGIQFEDGAHTLTTIEDNTILNDRDQTDAIILSNDSDGTHTQRLIDHNLLAGGGVCFYGAGGPAEVSTNITFTNNSFSPMFYDTCGSVTPVAYWNNPGGSNNTWSNNIWDDDGSAVNP